MWNELLVPGECFVLTVNAISFIIPSYYICKVSRVWSLNLSRIRIAGSGNLDGRVGGSYRGGFTLKPDIGPPVWYRPVTRPPLAGPFAFSRIPTPVWNKPRVFLMHDISNTWLFTNFSSGYLFASLIFVFFLIYSVSHHCLLLHVLYRLVFVY